MWGEKFKWITDTESEDFTQIVREWNGEWSIHEARVLSLALCNGSLLADTANMFSFAVQSPYVAGDNSPRQQSFSEKRSVSIEGSPSLGSNAFAFASPPMTETANKQNSPFFPGRIRASSTASGSAKVFNTSFNASASELRRPTSVDTGPNGNRPSASAEPSPHPPHLSIETPSPSLGIFPVDFSMRSPVEQHRFSGMFSSAMPMGESPRMEPTHIPGPIPPKVLFLAASVYEFNIDRSRREAGYSYLTYIAGEIFDVIGERGELWLAKNQDDPSGLVGWIWNKHFVKLSN